MSVLDVAAYFLLDSVWLLIGYWLLMLVPKGIVCAWNHHHQHVHTFRPAWMNRLYELSLAFHTGISSNLWVLHHNLGHHLNFLDQEKDESGWKRKDGKTMGVLEYSFKIAVTSYYRGYQVGRKYPKHQRVFVTFGLLTFGLLGALVWFRPLQGLFLFVLPMMTSLLYTTWVTYDHHAGLDTEQPFEASYNIMNPAFNWLTGNLGYHTAHHHRQAVHWSKLPALHATLAEKIPVHLFRRSTFDAFLPGLVSSPRSSSARSSGNLPEESLLDAALGGGASPEQAGSL